MKAFKCITSTTDIVRSANLTPRIDDRAVEYFANLDDFYFAGLLRLCGVRKRFPTATLVKDGFSVAIVIGDMEVYRKTLVEINPVAEEIGDYED
jgi:hypothetical protein